MTFKFHRYYHNIDRGIELVYLKNWKIIDKRVNWLFKNNLIAIQYFVCGCVATLDTNNIAL